MCKAAGLGDEPRKVLDELGGININKVEDLKGKTCVQSSLSTAEVPFLKAVMSAHGLEYPRDYSITVGGNMNTRVASMASNAVDCTMIPPPTSFQLVDQGKNEIAKTSDVMKDCNFIVVAVNADWGSKNRDVVVKTLRALNAGQTFAFDPKNRETVAQGLVKAKASPEQYALRTVDVFYGPGSKVQAPEIKLSVAALNRVIASMKDLGTFPKDQTPDWSRYVDTSYWQEATGALDFFWKTLV